MRLPAALLLLPLFSLRLYADSPRGLTRLDDDWKFIAGDPPGAEAAAFDDAAWRTVTLPHDWSIEGRMDPKAPMGGHGGFLPAGIGWYRQHPDAPAEWAAKKVEVEFEGVFEDASVYLNGQKLASHPYGFTSFWVDLTPAIKPGAGNILAVRVDNSHQKNCRWYSGSGIYRHVWLAVTGPVHIAPWGVFVSTATADAGSAAVTVRTLVLNETGTAQPATVRTLILGPDGKQIGVADSPCMLAASGSAELVNRIDLSNPPLWSPEQPRISSAVTRVMVKGIVADKVTTPFGVRAIAWSAQNGLTINGRTYKLSGGCIHDDNGVLGACAFDRAEERKIELLKAAGFNAIRTAHNPPSPALLDACDRLGMLVLDEAFDCWAAGKDSCDYHLVFKDWWQRDIDSMVERDRNHPSVIMWSIGNEIPQVFDAMGLEYGPALVARIHSLDTTRPVTNGILGWPKPDDAQSRKNAEAAWNSLDIVGSNYALGRHIACHAQSPSRVLVSTESGPPIGPASDVLKNPYVVGDFVWSAQDYLGEVGVGRWFYQGDPTEPLNPPRPGDPPGKINPVGHGNDRLYPWRGASCGGVDLIGDTKPAGHWRNIAWNMGEKLAMAVEQPAQGKKIIVVGWGWYPTWESWTWPGMEGKPIDVDVYSSYPQLRLYLNGKSLGDQNGSHDCKTVFHVTYEPGTLKAVGIENGQEVGGVSLQTAGPPSAIRLTADRTALASDGQDLSFVKVEVVDNEGRLQPNAGERVRFDLTGPATIAGLGNADLHSTEPFQGKSCHVYHGRALVVLRTTHEAGPVTLKAEARGLREAALSLRTGS